MPIWKLEPVNPDSEHWAASTYKGTAIVRAANEDRAREVATGALGIAAPIPASHRTLYSPWQQADVVRCSRLQGRQFPEDGPEGILDPKHYD
jgi:hypothetical protein